MGYGATTIGFGLHEQPVSATVSFEHERIYITFYDEEVARNCLANCQSALPYRFNIALSEIEGNWLGGSRAVQASAKPGKPREIAVIFENERRLLVGSTTLDAEALDEWVHEAFGVRPHGNPG